MHPAAAWRIMAHRKAPHLIAVDAFDSTGVAQGLTPGPKSVNK
jgi:hypothetical protein